MSVALCCAGRQVFHRKGMERGGWLDVVDGAMDMEGERFAFRGFRSVPVKETVPTPHLDIEALIHRPPTY